MATQKVVMAGSDVTALQLKDLFRQIGDGSLTGHHIQALLDHRDPFAVNLDSRYQLESQCQLWKELFGIELDPDSIALPERRPGFERLIVIPAGLTLNRIIEVYRQQFPNVDCYADDLDQSVIKNDRTNTETYAVWIRERVEADEELANLSADNLAERQVAGITLMERLLYGLKYFADTGNYLDEANWTLCSGSRDSDGLVPIVYWYPERR
jgi:hypothetical protein